MTQAIGARDLAVDAFFNGRWAEADQLIAEGVQSCVANGHLLVRPELSLPGRADGSRARRPRPGSPAGRRADPVGKPRHADLVRTWAAHINALDALGRGDFEEAYQNAATVSPPGTFPPYTATAVWVCLELVEAAMRTGREDEAASHVAAMREASLAAISPRLNLSSARARRSPPETIARPRSSTPRSACPRIRQWPFDTARVRLAYGEQLRRAHATAAARAQLTAAHAAFEQLGAEPWTARTAAELRAAGSRGTRPPPY